MHLDERLVPCLCWWCSGTDCTRTRHSQAFNLLWCSQKAQTWKLLFRLFCLRSLCIWKQWSHTEPPWPWLDLWREGSIQATALPSFPILCQMGTEAHERIWEANSRAHSRLQSEHLKWPSNYSSGQTRPNASLHIKVTLVKADANHKSLTSKETLKDASQSCQGNIQTSCNLSVMVIGTVENREQTILRDKAVIQPYLHMHLHHSLTKSWWNILSS